MRGMRAAAVAAAVVAAACNGRSDINVEGTITVAATSAKIPDATVTLSYQTVSFLDPGVIITKSDSVGHYKLHGRDVRCDGMALGVVKTGFQNSAQQTPKCEEAVQTMDFQMQP